MTFPALQDAAELVTRAQVLATPSPVPRSSGIYAWYFDAVPPTINVSGCLTVDGHTLLYVGISPKEPPQNGRAPSRSTLRDRLRTHYAGNAAGSTLRKTLGCLLQDELGWPLRRVGSGFRFTLTNAGEQALDAWMARHARVTWLAVERPWEVERELLQGGPPLPLNIKDNPCAAHVLHLSSVRRRAVVAATALPVVLQDGPRRARLPIAD
jgi:hypothetical protein